MANFAILCLTIICAHSEKYFSSSDIYANGISPEPRTSPSLSIDNSGNTIYLFGGHNKSSFLNDLWIFSIDTSIWSLIYAQSYSPNPRSNSESFFRTKKQEFCIFGGRSDDSIFSDLWCFSLLYSSWYKIEINAFTFSQIVKTRYLEYNETEYFIIVNVDSVGIVAFIFDFESDQFEKLEVNMSVNIKNNQEKTILEIQGNKIIIGVFDIEEHLNIYTCYINEMRCINQVYSNFIKINSGYIIENTIVDDHLLVFMSYGQILNFSLTSNFSSISSLESFKLPKNSGVSFYKNCFFTFGGLVDNTLDNTLTLYKVSQSIKIYPQILSNYQLFPPLRLRSALIAVRNKIYLFGGFSKFGLLNDFWVYDPSLEKWNQVLSKNDPPSPRHSFAYASIGDIIVIWGGISEKGYSNDFFIYNVVTKLWYELYQSSNLRPSKRFGACLVIDFPYFYIGGGIDELGLCNDLWIFDIKTGVYKKTQGKIGKAYSYCYKLEGKIEYMIGEILISNTTHQFFKGPPELNYWGSIVHKFSSGLLMISGSTFSGNLIKILEYSSYNLQISGSFSDYACNSMYTFYNHSIYYFSGSYYTSHFKVFHSIPRAKFARFDLKQAFQKYNLIFECSSGFIPSDYECKICPPGYYSNNVICVPCNKGHFNPLPGASSSRQCYPCPEGTFSDKEGSSFCKMCLNGHYCYAGSHSPEIILAKTKIKKDSQIYFDEIKYTKKVEIIINQSGIIMIFTIALISLLSPKAKKIISKWDLYSDYHNYKENDRIYINKNIVGGMFSVLFYISFACICTRMIMNYFLNNKNEEQSLIPLVLFSSMIEKFSVDFEIVVGIRNYADVCVSANFMSNPLLQEFDFSDCASNILLTFNNLKRQKLTTKCKFTNDRLCLIKISCIKCEVESNSIINLFMQGEFSYGAGIFSNITSESSIPNYYSTAYSEIFPSKNRIFLGPSPCIFTYLLIPSLFVSHTETESLVLAGYHTQELSLPVKGSEKSFEDLFLPDQLAIKIVLKKNTLGLMKEIKKKQSNFELFGTLFGIFTGLLGVIGFTMRRVECINLNRNSEKLKKSIGKVIDSRLFYDVQLNISNDDCKKEKQ
ncbi:hypothetical protein SteCoe_23618 [Stentor coeruleus]|uniref:Tyrosine-protein kinase ephrin type A/B receptor-like domain-containing protein n=1 Tax=Stentor coeruleus TaxID=5963 RepID=A0A1R2BJI2_9CILI|nr:hypothetical protein SteCoe_23618 [Stentor coeruleus]